MRKLVCAAFLILFYLTVNAQNPSSADCRTAIPICADASINNTVDGVGDVDDFDPEVISFTGCLGKGGIDADGNIEFNSAWFVFRAGRDGQLGFDIRSLPISGNDSPSAEIDFALYGPDVDCADISGGIEPIRCNYESNDTDVTGLGINPVSRIDGTTYYENSENTYDEWLDVQEGEIYYLFINNFEANLNGDAEPFKITFTGSSVDADEDSALDCDFRDQFLGQDISACAGDMVTLSALNSPAGSDIVNIQWSADYDGDGVPEANLAGGGLFGAELEVTTTGNYFVRIETSAGPTFPVLDDIMVTFYDPPNDSDVSVEIIDTNLAIDPDRNDVEIVIASPEVYEYAINGGEFQDEPIFRDIPSGINTVIVRNRYGCGETNPIEFLVIGYDKFFTPNGDDNNDNWNIKGVEQLINPRTYIYDRYGKLLAQIEPGALGWDGTYNGRRMPSTDYWFRFEYSQDESGVRVAKLRKTHFSLKR